MLLANCYKTLLPNLLLCQRQASVMMAARSEYCGVQPKTLLAFFASATGTGGSSARRDASRATISCPVIHRAVSTTWRTDAPGSVPRLTAWPPQRQHMCAREIVHMNMVTDGLAIRRQTIGSKYRDIGSFPEPVSACEIAPPVTDATADA